MKQIMIGMVALTSLVAFAGVIEGRLVAKLEGELDPFILGDGCISVVEYFDGAKGSFKTIAIYQDDSSECISSDVEENEEVDFDLKGLKLIKDKAQLEELKDLTSRVMGVKDVKTFYKL